MEFQKVIALRGPNIWAKFPVLEAWVELGALKDSASNEMPGFNDRLMAWLPSMIEHRCSEGHRGGFFERLRRGTYLAHVLEHVTLELQNQAGIDLGYGRARETTKEGLFRVALRYEDEAVGRICLETGRRLCLAAVYDQPFDVEGEIAKINVIADNIRLGPSTRTVVRAAKARGIPVRRLNDQMLIQLGQGNKQRRINRSSTDATRAVAEALSDDKNVTKEYLRSVGVPVPKGRLVYSAEDAWQAAQEIGTPVVVKPNASNYGNAVVIGISKREQIEGAYEVATTEGGGVLVEQVAPGLEHRLLVIGGRFIAAARGNPAFVIGDGQQTIAELIESQLNSDPRRGKTRNFPLAPVEFDAGVLLTLEQEGYDRDSVPPRDKKVMIQRNGNLAFDETDEVHPSVARAAERAARAVGLDVAGIDVIAEDISRPLESQNGVVLEVNSSPGLHAHVEPQFGTPRPVGDAVISTLFPGETNGRIPFVAICEGQDSGLVTRLVAHLLAANGTRVGKATADGIALAGEQIVGGDARGIAGSSALVMNPDVAAAVCEVSLASIVDEGLGFDRCQVGVITSIGDGYKLDFAEGDLPEKRALVYRGIGDVVLPEGFLVIRAGEPLGSIVIEHCPGTTILFSAEEQSEDVAQARAEGKKTVVVALGQITCSDGQKEESLPIVTKLPAEAQAAAVATAWALGMPISAIAKAIDSFPA